MEVQQMEGPRACKKEELDKVIGLINKTFRTPNNFKGTMGEEFNLMLSERNLNNMRIILEDKVPVADVNFYKSTILIEGTPIKAASIGAVCTDVNSRGKGYSSLLLDDCEKIMKEESIRLMLVSGTRELYLRRGCTVVGKCYKFIIEPSKECYRDIQLQEYEDYLLEAMTKIYNKECTRYYRTYEEFKSLLKGATTPWANFTFKTYVVKDSHDYSAYIVLKIINNKEGKWGYVVEAAGDRQAVNKALKEAIKLNSLKYIEYYCTFNDNSTNLFKKEKNEIIECDLQGTIKILDFQGLMMDLMPYFAQHANISIIENIRFYEEPNKYIFSLKNETLEINDIHNLTKLVFGSKQNIAGDFSDKPLLNEFVSKVFPLPFVWSANLNYQ
jgi:predicted acetyltransferase